MASLLRPFTLIAQATKAFFRADVRLRRGDRGLEVVLDETPPPPARGRRGAPRPDAAALKAQQELQAIQRSLTALLDELPENRTTLRHLAFIEHALAKKGLRALPKVPYDVLKRALDQFEGVVVNWSDEGLATLRSKMAVTLIEREAEAPRPAEAAAPAGERELAAEIEPAPLAPPVALEGEDAAAAEAALMAAYGNVMLPDLELAPLADSAAAAAPAVELQGELHSPSAKAIAKAVRRGDDVHPQARAPELQA